MLWSMSGYVLIPTSLSPLSLSPGLVMAIPWGVYPNTCWCSKFDRSDGSNGDVDVVAGFLTEGQTRFTDEILEFWLLSISDL